MPLGIRVKGRIHSKIRDIETRNVAGIFPGRTSDEQITFHANNNGTAAADLAIAQWVYEQCRRMGRGNPIELPRPGEQ